MTNRHSHAPVTVGHTASDYEVVPADSVHDDEPRYWLTEKPDDEVDFLWWFAEWRALETYLPRWTGVTHAVVGRRS
jgi:hypothetical protein